MMLNKQQDIVTEITDLMQLLTDVKTLVLADNLEDTNKLLNIAAKDLKKLQNKTKQALN